MLDLPLSCLPVLSKTCHLLPPTTNRSCSCEQPFTFRLTLRNGCIRNSLYAPYSSSISTWFPLFLWNVFLPLCKFCVNSRYHSWNGKYQWHGWFPSPFIFSAIPHTQCKNLKQFVKMFSNHLLQQMPDDLASEKLYCCCSCLSRYQKCLLLKYSWKLKLKTEKKILWPQGCPSTCSIYKFCIMDNIYC